MVFENDSRIMKRGDSSSRLESHQTPPPAITATFRYIDDHLSESLLLEDIAKQYQISARASFSPRSSSEQM